MKKKHIIIISVFTILFITVIVLLWFVYKSLFAGNDTRNEGYENYTITVEEKDKVEALLKETEEVKDVNVHTNNDSRIIKIVVTLTEEINVADAKALADETLKCFSEDNISYFDVEFFIDTVEESEVYPKIGYKYRANQGFSW